MKKKMLAVILSMTMAAALLGGCGNEQKESSAAKEPAATEQPAPQADDPQAAKEPE